jgi:cystathionine gamma-synthase/methionine-gamma-lyase
MKFETKTVHWADRKKQGNYIPVTTPIHTAASYVYDSMDQLDRIFGQEEQGPSYARFDNPTRSTLEELMRELEAGAGAVACASGMIAIHTGIMAALLDRPKRIICASAIYGATAHLLMNILGPLGVETTMVDLCDLKAFEEAVAEVKPGAVIMETISNPLLRVGAMDRISEICRRANAPLIVDNTFATPLLVRPLELGAHITVHSATKYLGGHGDVLGGVLVADQDCYDAAKSISRTLGPIMGPFDAYLTLRGIKTLGLRVTRQNENACRVASYLASNPNVERVYFPGDPKHPDAETIARLFPKGFYGAMVSFELKNASRAEVFRFMEKLQLVVRATSLGDVHTMILYPAMASHRDLAPKQRQRLGIHDNLVRLSVGIEAVEDIVADLEEALSESRQ